MHAANMRYRGSEETKQHPGCKYAFGCALLFAFLFLITMPFSGAFVWLELNSWGF